jgi:hypothetical protein
VSAPVKNLVERLHAKRSGKGWIAKCPAHEDHKPSLSLGEGADGRALLKCHAGCSTDDVLAADNLLWFNDQITAMTKTFTPYLGFANVRSRVLPFLRSR